MKKIYDINKKKAGEKWNDSEQKGRRHFRVRRNCVRNREERQSADGRKIVLAH